MHEAVVVPHGRTRWGNRVEVPGKGHYCEAIELAAARMPSLSREESVAVNPGTGLPAACRAASLPSSSQPISCRAETRARCSACRAETNGGITVGKILRVSVVMLVVVLASAACGCAQGGSSASSSGSASGSAQGSTQSAQATRSAQSAQSATDLAPGTYRADFTTDSSMFHVNEADKGKGVLTVADDGAMTIHVSLVSKKIVNLYAGLASEAEANAAKAIDPTTDTVTYSDGTTEEVHGFDIPVPALEQEFDVAILGEKGTWYDHKVSVTNPEAM